MMTEEQKQALIARLEKALNAANSGLTHHSYASSLGEGDIVTVYGIALAALTQPASPALKLPDGWVAVPNEPTEDMIAAGSAVDGGVYCIWKDMIFAAPDAPHTAPIEPICATGGAEWVKCSERMPRSNETVQFYVADDKAIKQGRFISGSWHQEQDWCESSYGGVIDSEVCGNITHWMPLPAAPEEK